MCVQVHVNLFSSPATISAPLTPTCISWSPAGSITLVSSPSEIAATIHLKPSTWGNQRGARSHQTKFLAPLSGTQRRYKYASPDNNQFLAPLSDSCIQNRGVARYILSLLFSLVSLPFSFCPCVPYPKKVCLVPCSPSMPNFFETRSYWHGGFTKDQQEYRRNATCLKRGYNYGEKYISCMSMLETCAQYIIYLSAGMNIVAL